MTVKLRQVLIGSAVAVCMWTSDAAAAGTGDFVLGLSSGTPGALAAATFDVTYRDAVDAAAKPPAIAGATFRLPAGTRIDTTVVPRCDASDEELQSIGASACPAATRVGAGTLTAVTGFGAPIDPVAGEVTVFNGTDELIEVVRAPGTDRVLGLDRLRVQRNTLVANPPATPGGPPDGRTAVSGIHLELEPIPGLVTTPWRCPASGAWSYSAEFRFEDGSSDSESRSLPCERPSLTLSVRPRRAVVGEVTTFRVRVASQSAACVRRARIGFAGRRLRVDEDGRVTVRATLGATGPRMVRAAATGCRATEQAVRVVRR